jgi:hypothetical protein
MADPEMLLFFLPAWLFLVLNTRLSEKEKFVIQ